MSVTTEQFRDALMQEYAPRLPKGWMSVIEGALLEVRPQPDGAVEVASHYDGARIRLRLPDHLLDLPGCAQAAAKALLIEGAQDDPGEVEGSR